MEQNDVAPNSGGGGGTAQETAPPPVAGARIDHLTARDLEYRWNLARIKGCEPAEDEEFFSGYRKSHRRMRG